MKTKTSHLVCMLIVALGFFMTCSNDPETVDAPPLVTDPEPNINFPLSDQENNGNWVLNEDVSDEFNEASLDEGKWQIQGKNDIYKSNFIGRHPSQFSPDNAIVSDGKLQIWTKWESNFPFSNETREQCEEIFSYENITTAAVISREQFQYGYMEVKVKSANARITSSFWTTGFQSELDMFEMFGNPGAIAGSAWAKRLKFNMVSWNPSNPYYLPSGNGPAYTRNIQAQNNTADNFNVYGFEWTADFVKVHINGELHPNGTFTKDEVTNNGTDPDRWVTDVPYWIWFDSETFCWLGLPEEQDLPVAYEIDYVRIWQN